MFIVIQNTSDIFLAGEKGETGRAGRPGPRGLGGSPGEPGNMIVFKGDL